MPQLTRRHAIETIRKLGWGLCLACLAGCATRGPNHVYLTAAGSPAVHDLGPPAVEIADILPAAETALGLAYDFNTDHLFVRTARAIRVIERPSGKILREMPLPSDLHTLEPADLAIRSRDRHLFAVHPNGRSIVEFTLFGDLVSRLELTGLTGEVRGLAFDQRSGRLLALVAEAGRIRVGAITLEGRIGDYVTLAAPVNAVSLGYDSDAQHFFVPLADERSLGEFDAKGTLVRSHSFDRGPITAVDAGPRSFVRVF